MNHFDLQIKYNEIVFMIKVVQFKNENVQYSDFIFNRNGDSFY